MNRLRHKLQQRQSDLILVLAPRLQRMPVPMQRYDDPFLPFGKAVISATRDLVAGYWLDLASYMAIGAAGMVALERTIAFMDNDLITILHAPFASPAFAEAVSASALNVDAVTLADTRFAADYLDTGVGVFASNGSGDTGVYDEQEASLMFDNIHLKLLGEDVVYAGRGEDFADTLRAVIEAQR